MGYDGRMTRRLVALALGWLAAGCSGAPPPDDRPGTPGVHDIDTIVRAHPRGDQPVGRTEVHRGPRVSIHLIEVADAVAPHRHLHSDETVVCWRGGGLLRIGDEAREIQAGMVLHVPRGVVHSFRRTSPEPAIFATFYTPPFVEGDREPAE